MKSSLLINSKSLPIFNLNAPSAEATTFFLSATIKITSPVLASVFSIIAFISSSVKNLAIGEVIPSAVSFIYASPFAPKYVFTYSSYSEITFLENFSFALGATTALTSPPFLTVELKALKEEFLTISDKSFNSTPNLKSGLSEPNLSIASA